MGSLEVCKRKVNYTRAQAKVEMIKRGNIGSYYRCPHGNHYHVTKRVPGFVPKRVWRQIEK